MTFRYLSMKEGTFMLGFGFHGKAFCLYLGWVMCAFDFDPEGQ